MNTLLSKLSSGTIFKYRGITYKKGNSTKYGTLESFENLENVVSIWKNETSIIKCHIKAGGIFQKSIDYWIPGNLNVFVELD